MSTKPSKSGLSGEQVVDPQDYLIKSLILEVPNVVPRSYEASEEVVAKRHSLEARFPTIRSNADPAATFEVIRMRMKSAAKISGTWRGSVGFIEVSIKDMLNHGCIVHGRNFMLPECGIGVHDSAHPIYWTKDRSKHFDKAERAANRKKCCRIIGCNCNGAGTAKALLAATCLRLGIRCLLKVGRCVIVNNWPNYDEDREILTKNYCEYSCS